MSTPERIYLQIPDDAEDYDDAARGEVTWCVDKINDRDIEYVRVALLTEAERPRESPLGWRPFESAPKDGSVFLSCWGETPQFVAYLPPTDEDDAGGFRVLMPPARDMGWGIHGNYAPFTPTRWMPIPPSHEPVGSHPRGGGEDALRRLIPGIDDIWLETGFRLDDGEPYGDLWINGEVAAEGRPEDADPSTPPRQRFQTLEAIVELVRAHLRAEGGPA